MRFLRTHNGEIVKGQGALMCGEVTGAAAEQGFTDDVHGLSDFARGKRVDTVSWTHVGEGLQHRNVIRWLSALPGGTQWRGTVPAQREPKEGHCEGCGLQRSRSLSWYRTPEIRTDSPG